MKSALIILFLVAAVPCLLAQTPSHGPLPATAAASAPVTVVGCVMGLNGAYVLTTAANKQYQLQGDDLASYSGQKIRALGTVTHAKKGADDTATMTVSRIDKLADTCSPGK